VENSYLNTDMCKFKLLQSEEGRVRSADSSKACSKCRSFDCSGSVEDPV